jgi:glycosyltransferase involved in cell wall biosynthesis
MTTPTSAEELVVFSHLRWTGVWQRPQHLISRLGRDVPTWFVEEPVPGAGGPEPWLASETDGAVDRLYLEVPDEVPWLPFGAPEAVAYEDLLGQALPPRPGRIAWLYTATALDLALAGEPDLLVYDVMDDIASFKVAAPRHRELHEEALRRADLVFTGGRSLHRGVLQHRTDDVHCFPSGVEVEHFAPARNLRERRRPRPVAGYVGVVDERLDLELIEELARCLPDWDIAMVGPVVKLDDVTLPSARNLFWLGSRPYDLLPEVMAGFDVALMPFALNEATRSISPTKTLEYFAAGLPVVSTRVPDVVADHSEVVQLADDGEGFAEACRSVRHGVRRGVQRGIDEVLATQCWDGIATRMADLIDAAGADPAPAQDDAGTLVAG